MIVSNVQPNVKDGQMAPRKDKKPVWVVEKERVRRTTEAETVWLFGTHAVRDALMNPARVKLRLVVTKNAADKLADAITKSGMVPEIQDPRRFNVPIDAQSVHQGAALEVKPLDWGGVSEQCAPRGERSIVIVLDRVTDPHNVGAILRSAEVFGARAVIATLRNSAPETGALAKTASGALERQPYLRVQNLVKTMNALSEMGYRLIALDGEADIELQNTLDVEPNAPTALVLGAEGPGLRQSTKETCDVIAKIPFQTDFGSLNVSNAAAVSLYALSQTKSSS
jgi:23S rRNA (guanosine2251-2'-O)-methyltransferase